MTTTLVRDDRAGLLYDYAVEHPDGFVFEDTERAFGWSLVQFKQAVNALRRILGSDEINLVCYSQGSGERWRYRLVGNADDDATRFWQANRIGDLEARLETIQNVSQSIACGTDGRTTVGRKARMIAGQVRGLRDSLAVITEIGNER